MSGKCLASITTNFNKDDERNLKWYKFVMYLPLYSLLQSLLPGGAWDPSKIIQLLGIDSVSKVKKICQRAVRK